MDDVALLQLRKACRLLSGATALRDEAYYTLVVEASVVAIERTIEFRLLERGDHGADSDFDVEGLTAALDVAFL